MQAELQARLAALKAAAAATPKQVEFPAGTPVQELKLFLHLMIAAGHSPAMSIFPAYNPPAFRFAPRSLTLQEIEREEYVIRCWHCGEQVGTCRYYPMFIMCPSCSSVRPWKHYLDPAIVDKLFYTKLSCRQSYEEEQKHRRLVDIIYSDVLGEMYDARSRKAAASNNPARD